MCVFECLCVCVCAWVCVLCFSEGYMTIRKPILLSEELYIVTVYVEPLRICMCLNSAIIGQILQACCVVCQIAEASPFDFV